MEWAIWMGLADMGGTWVINGMGGMDGGRGGRYLDVDRCGGCHAVFEMERFFYRGIQFFKMLGIISGQHRKCLGFGAAKTVKLGTLSLISHAQSLILKPLFHPHNT